MLARFENGWFLEVIIKQDINGFHQYAFTVYDEDCLEIRKGYTEYRSMEMYYPMNEIDYMLEFCEPYGLEGKYELFEQETMLDYELYMDYGDGYGDWILERQGTDYDDIRYYETEERAIKVMMEEAEELAEEYENLEIDEEYSEVSEPGYFQYYKVYKNKTHTNEKERLFNEIELEIERIYTGVSQYAWELQDTDVINDHIFKVEELIKELKELM